MFLHLIRRPWGQFCQCNQVLVGSVWKAVWSLLRTDNFVKRCSECKYTALSEYMHCCECFQALKTIEIVWEYVVNPKEGWQKLWRGLEEYL